MADRIDGAEKWQEMIDRYRIGYIVFDESSEKIRQDLAQSRNDYPGEKTKKWSTLCDPKRFFNGCP